MQFKDILNKYMEELKCTNKELSNTSGISESVVSRYRNGDRIPRENTEQLTKLSLGLYNISIKKNITKYTKEFIYNDLVNSINNDNFDYDSFSKNFNTLITELNIKNNDMAKYIAFDASHISRIRYGKTKTTDPYGFSTKVCNYILSRYTSLKDKRIIANTINCDYNDTVDDNKLFYLLFNFLTNNSNNKVNKNYISDFLNNLNEFNLDDYIKAIKFDKLKVPNIPIYIIKPKNYYGIEGMKKGELDFFKAVVLSKGKEDVFMCSDMPMEDMARDVLFGKKWMFAIAMCLKKGLHLNIIHNLDRPFNEMMLGLESWIPIYMTGQVSPYYFKENKNNIYNHLNYVSGNVILTGECIKGYHDKGKYYLTNNSKEIAYYKEKARLLLKKSNSLMDIYKLENKDSYKLFLTNDIKTKDIRKRIISSLPLFTIDEVLLKKILEKNNINDTSEIINYYKQEKKNMETILNNNIVNDIIYEIDKDIFDKENICLSLENIFYDKKIKYTYNDYLKHLENTKKYAKNNKNYNLTISNNKVFNNINITILNNNYVVISKSANPVIHFVIRHPKLIEAIDNFNPIIIEN